MLCVQTCDMEFTNNTSVCNDLWRNFGFSKNLHGSPYIGGKDNHTHMEGGREEAEEEGNRKDFYEGILTLCVKSQKALV